jgi:hypothetical protein
MQKQSQAKPSLACMYVAASSISSIGSLPMTEGT